MSQTAESDVSKSLKKNLYVATRVIIQSWAKQYPMNIALQKIRKKEEQILNKLDDPEWPSKDLWMWELEAIRDFKNENGIS